MQQPVQCAGAGARQAGPAKLNAVWRPAGLACAAGRQQLHSSRLVEDGGGARCAAALPRYNRPCPSHLPAVAEGSQVPLPRARALALEEQEIDLEAPSEGGSGPAQRGRSVGQRAWRGAQGQVSLARACSCEGRRQAAVLEQALRATLVAPWQARTPTRMSCRRRRWRRRRRRRRRGSKVGRGARCQVPWHAGPMLLRRHGCMERG